MYSLTPEQTALLKLVANPEALENLLVSFANRTFDGLTKCQEYLTGERIATILIANFNSRHFPQLFITNLNLIIGKFREAYEDLSENRSINLSKISNGRLANLRATELSTYSDCGIMEIVSLPNFDKEIHITTKGLAIITEMGRISALSDQEFSLLEPKFHIQREQFINHTSELREFYLASKR